MKIFGALFLLLPVVFAAPAGETTQSADTLHFEERVVAGSPDDFMLVKHIVLRGSNFSIGRKLAEIARDEHGASLTTVADPLKGRVLRNYMARNFPIHHERMRGVEALLGTGNSGQDGAGGQADWSGLFYNVGSPEGSGCSVVFYPPASTASGTGVMSRNYDFSTGTLDGRVPPPGAPAATSRPYVVELYPDTGYASIALTAYDLVGGAIDGINSEGLCVALLADDESAATRAIEPAMGTEVGLYELNIPRFLLDNAANCAEAKEMLLTAKHYYSFMPLHYIVADRHGESFVWEYSYSSNKEYVIDGAGKPQIVTNHPLYRFSRIEDFPAPAETNLNSYERYRTLTSKIQEMHGRGRKASLDAIKETNACVAAVDAGSPPPGSARGRTLWHALYYPEERRAEVDFYLGDKPDPEHSGRSRIARSGYREFRLDSRP